MAMPPGMESAKMLKDMKKGKEKPEDKPDAGGGDVLADIDKALGDTAEGDDELAKADDEMAEAEMGGVGAPPRGDAGGDPVAVFSKVLELDDITAQAVYGEAMNLPELAEMAPDAMAKKIKGNYDLLKKIIVSMGEKAAMAMQDEMNQPMGPPGAGPEMGPPGGAPAPPMA